VKMHCVADDVDDNIGFGHIVLFETMGKYILFYTYCVLAFTTCQVRRSLTGKALRLINNITHHADLWESFFSAFPSFFFILMFLKISQILN
jgi:hypothetical protein